jgi:autophagy-related protein 9
MFSRLGQSSRGTRSFYQDLRSQDDDPDVESEAGLNLDDENLGQNFNDVEADGIMNADSRMTVDSVAHIARDKSAAAERQRREPTSRWLQDEDGDNDVPASLLIEHNEGQVFRALNTTAENPGQRADQRRPTRAAPSPARNEAQWEAATTRQPLHRDENLVRPPRPQPRSIMAGVMAGGARDKALWRWVNISNLDSFMRDVYDYYEGGGFWCILSSNALWLL